MTDILTTLDNAAAYTWGNCTYYVATVASWIPAGLGNAYQWFGNAKAKGFATSSTPRVGSVVVYGAGGGYSEFGHVAYVTGVNSNGTFDVTEMNYRGLNVVDTRTSTMKDVLGFILPPPGTSASPTSSPWPGICGAPVVGGALCLPGQVASGLVGGSSSSSGSCGWTDVGCWLGQLEQLVTRGFWVAIGALIIIVGLAMLLIEDVQKGAEQAAPAVEKFVADNPEVLAA